MTGAAVRTPRTLVEGEEPPYVPVQSPGPALIHGWRWLQRPLIAGLLLLIVYAGVAFALNDPRGTLGTDTGGKLATLQMMQRHGGLDPDIGYWAEQADPTGRSTLSITRTASVSTG